MKSFATALLVCAMAATVVPASTGRASAAGTPLQICNQTSEHINVAVGYHSTGVNDAPNSNVLTGPFVSTGWWRVEGGKCMTFANPFGARYMFWYGFSPTGGLNATTPWATNGLDNFCIANIHGPQAHGFTLEDENASQTVCAGSRTADGPNEWVSVRKVDIVVNARVDFNGG
jgi:uncharacterized membrane protein